jgi:aspartyl protease family protein
MNRAVVLVIALVVIGLLVAWLAAGSGQAFGTDQGSASFAYTVAILVLVLSSLILGWRGSASQALRYALIWVAIGFALITAYAYRDELRPVWQRIAGEVNPAMPVQRSASEVVLRRAQDNHFYADVDVNGTSIRMMVDTGASMVVLSESDAEYAGIDPDQLEYNLVVSTANGQAAAAEVTIDEIRIGSIVRTEVRGAVSRGLSGSLLGMSFFSSLSKVQMESDELVLAD